MSISLFDTCIFRPISALYPPHSRLPVDGEHRHREASMVGEREVEVRFFLVRYIVSSTSHSCN